MRLYTLAGLSGETENLTKHDIIDCIVVARDDLASPPPTSPPRMDGSVSDASSEDDFPGTEPEDDVDPVDMITPRASRGNLSLRRRATTNGIGRPNGRLPTGRSLSMGHLHDSSRLAAAAASSQSSGKPLAKQSETRSVLIYSVLSSLINCC